MSEVIENNKTSKLLKKTVFGLVMGNLIGIIIFFAFVFVTMAKYEKRSYVLSYGGDYLMQSHDGRNYSSFEVENFVKVFLKLMYGHDANTYQERVTTALQYVSKKDGQAIVDDFKKEKLYDQYIRTGAGIRMEVDSILLDMEQTPYKGIAYARQLVFNGSRGVVVPFGLKFEIGHLPRSSANPLGLQMRELTVFKYDLKYDRDSKREIDAPSEYEKGLMKLEENLEEPTQTRASKSLEKNDKNKNAP